LVLTSNLSFANAVFADIGSVDVTVKGARLEITGDVLIGDALILLGFPKSTSGLRVGSLVVSADLAVACTTDIDGDGQRGSSDLANLLGEWGTAGSADFNGDGVVGSEDLSALLGAWGPC
jgi:hypothetical protein